MPDGLMNLLSAVGKCTCQLKAASCLLDAGAGSRERISPSVFVGSAVTPNANIERSGKSI